MHAQATTQIIINEPDRPFCEPPSDGQPPDGPSCTPDILSGNGGGQGEMGELLKIIEQLLKVLEHELGQGGQCSPQPPCSGGSSPSTGTPLMNPMQYLSAMNGLQNAYLNASI